MPTPAQLPPKAPKILIWGPMRTGKTAFAYTLGARAQCLDIGEEGWLTALNLQDQWTDARKSVDVVLFKETKLPKAAHAFEDFKRYVYDVGAQAFQGKFPFDALIVDSLTELGRMALNQILSNSGKLGGQPEIQHYGLAFQSIQMVIDVLCAMPIPVVLIGHDQKDSVGQGATKQDFIELALQGKNMPAVVPRKFDEVWYARVKPEGAGKFKYVMQTKADGLVHTGSRGNLPDMFDTSVGLWSIIEQLGYKSKERKS